MCSGKLLIERKNKEKVVQVIDCESCGYAHLHPKPSAEFLSQYYREQFYQNEKPAYLSKMETELEYWLLWYGWRVSHIEALLDSSYGVGFAHQPVFPSRESSDCKSSGQKKHVLDVGSSGGFFLEAAKNCGWECEGIEPSPYAAQYSIKKFHHTVAQVSFEDFNVRSHFYSSLHCAQVLEHLLEPSNFFRFAKKALHSEGILCVEVPFEFNEFQNILTGHLKKEPWFISYPDHINYFTVESFKSLAKKNGFEILELYSDFPMEFFVLQGEDYIGVESSQDGETTKYNDEVGQWCHQKRMQFEMNLLNSNKGHLLKELYRGFLKLGIGRSLIAFLKLDKTQS